MSQHTYPVRERIANRLGELARMLTGSPTAAQVAAVQAELTRLAGNA